MILAIPGLKRVLSGVLVAAAGALLLSCGGSSSTTTPPSGLKFRAFVSQNVAAATAAPGLIVVNAQLDRLGAAAPISAGPSPGLMAEAANHQLTLVFNSSNDEVDIVNNAKETSAGKVTLPGSTESMAVTSDATLAFAAVPTAPVAGLTPGEVEIINLTSPSLQAPVPNCVATAGNNCSTPIPNVLSGARFIVLSSDNTHLLVFGDNPNAVTVVTLTNLGSTSAPNWNVSEVAQVTGNLDHPVWATFSPDNRTAYILSCGAECGGTTASVTPLQFTGTGACSQNCLGTTTVLPGGATYSAAAGNTVYVVGSEQCTGAADPTACGKLTVLNTSGNTVQLVRSATITDGYHNRMAITADNQVFVGAQGCTTISTSTVQRGCLSIYNANNGNVVIGTDIGPVTGIAAVTGRPQVYVIENGEFRNWTTTTDTPAPLLHQIDIVGQAVDVVLAD